jgi:dTDP-4-amino-4,6-dideoxygalactose transaminase
MPARSRSPSTIDTETAPDIPLFDLRLGEDDLAAVRDALRSGWLSMGPRTAAFEEAFAEHLDVKHAVAVSSCTAALHLAYLAAGVGPGDEVVVPSMTFAATASAVVYCGGSPVFADSIGLHDFSLSTEDVERRLTPRTKAVCAMHFAGFPAPLYELRSLCEERGLALLEDAAHAPHSDIDGRMLGTFGLAGAFSFFSNKALACGEGGLLATDDDAVAELARRLRNQGMTSSSWSRYTGSTEAYEAARLGFNYRFDDHRAALVLSRLQRLPDDVARRRELTRAYRRKLAAIDGISIPYSDAAVDHSTCYVMPIMVDPPRRDAVRRKLRDEHRIQTSVLYPAVHELSVYRRNGVLSLPVAEHIARGEITLPLFPELDESAQDRVVAALAEALQ